jgi:protein SCO1/2
MLTLLAPAAAHAQAGNRVTGLKQEAGTPSSVLPKPLREIGFDQNLDRQLPLDATFRNEAGQTVRLGDYFGTRPVVLVFAYYDCPMLCTQVLNSLASTLDVLTLQPNKDFDVVTISIDPREKPALAAAKKAVYLKRYKRAGAAEGWHFLTGDEPQIKRVTAAAGFRYAWDDDLKQFAHPTGVIVVTPEGRLARYLFGIEYGARDLRFALIDASSGKIGTRVDNLLLYCYHYDPETGRYGLWVMRALRIAGVATVLAMGAFIVVMTRKDKNVRDQRGAASAPRFPKV